MATNKPGGGGHWNDEVKNRSQLKTKMMGKEHETKRDTKTGEFVAVKKDDGKFKGVRKEN